MIGEISPDVAVSRKARSHGTGKSRQTTGYILQRRLAGHVQPVQQVVSLGITASRIFSTARKESSTKSSSGDFVTISDERELHLARPDIEFALCVSLGLRSSISACLRPVGLKLPGCRPCASLAFGVGAVPSRAVRGPDSPVTMRRGNLAAEPSSPHLVIFVISRAFVNAGIHGVPTGQLEPFGNTPKTRIVRMPVT